MNTAKPVDVGQVRETLRCALTRNVLRKLLKGATPEEMARQEILRVIERILNEDYGDEK